MNSKDVLRHIENEKEISHYRIKSLKKISNLKPYKKRLLKAEIEFYNFPFENIEFTSIDSVRFAMDLFKTSRIQFEKKYGIKRPIAQRKPSTLKVSKRDRSKLKSMISFLDIKYNFLISSVLEKTNVVENKFYRSLLAISISKKNKISEKDAIKVIKKMSLNNAIGLESQMTKKIRAREQALVYSVARQIYLKKREALLLLKNIDSVTKQDFIEKINVISEGIISLDESIFKYYNEGIEECPVILKKSVSKNECFQKIPLLKNLLKENKNLLPSQVVNSGSFKDLEKDYLIRGLYSKSGSRTSKHLTKSFGIITTMKRLGNEKIQPFYTEIYLQDGIDISKIFKNYFFNIICSTGESEEYFKVLSCISKDDMKNKEINESLIKLYKDLMNSGGSNISTKIDDLKSKILIPPTRSEGDKLKEASFRVLEICNQISDQFNKKFTTTND